MSPPASHDHFYHWVHHVYEINLRGLTSVNSVVIK